MGLVDFHLPVLYIPMVFCQWKTNPSLKSHVSIHVVVIRQRVFGGVAGDDISIMGKMQTSE